MSKRRRERALQRVEERGGLVALKICDPFQNRKIEGKENIQVGEKRQNNRE